MSESRTRRKLPVDLDAEVAADTRIPPAAKLVLARLSWLDVTCGQAFPGQETLAKELGLSVKTVGRSVELLRARGLIAGTVRRGKRRTNLYVFDRTKCPVETDKMSSATGQNVRSNSKEELEKSEEDLEDFDSPTRSPKPRSTPGTQDRACSESDLGELSACLSGYMGEEPSRRVLQDVMLAAGQGVSEAQVVCVLESRRAQYPRGHAKGPQSWAWFVSVVENHFDERRARALPAGRDWRLPDGRYGELTGAIDPSAGQEVA